MFQHNQEVPGGGVIGIESCIGDPQNNQPGKQKT